MCGIIGYSGTNTNAVEVLLEGLEKVEYRGYDSAGIAFVTDKGIQIEKKEGKLDNLENTALAYATFDYTLFRQFTFIANKPVYGLILNSFKEMYIQVASLFFREEIARLSTFEFYKTLKILCEQGDDEAVQQCIAKNRQQSGIYWTKILQDLPEDFGKQVAS